MKTSVPVVVAARQVRLSAAHLELLFGAGASLVDICDLPPTGAFASASTVRVRGPAGELQHVRVVGPIARQTSVRLSMKDALVVGVETAGAAREIGCTIEGPRGTVVLAGGVKVGLRMLALTSEIASKAELKGGMHATVTVRGERERELKDVLVAIENDSWLEVDIDDANALEVGPSTRATL